MRVGTVLRSSAVAVAALVALATADEVRPPVLWSYDTGG